MKKLGLILLSLVIAGHAYAYDVSSLNGTVNCTSTTTLGRVLGSHYPALSIAGSITMVADGQGNYTSGSAIYEFMLNNINMAYYYNLLTGAYLVNADGTGSSTTSWSALPGSAQPYCSQIVRFNLTDFSIPSRTFWTPKGRSSNESGTCTLAPSS